MLYPYGNNTFQKGASLRWHQSFITMTILTMITVLTANSLLITIMRTACSDILGLLGSCDRAAAHLESAPNPSSHRQDDLRSVSLRFHHYNHDVRVLTMMFLQKCWLGFPFCGRGRAPAPKLIRSKSHSLDIHSIHSLIRFVLFHSVLVIFNFLTIFSQSWQNF